VVLMIDCGQSPLHISIDLFCIHYLVLCITRIHCWREWKMGDDLAYVRHAFVASSRNLSQFLGSDY